MGIVDDIAGLRRILARSRMIAIVGLSANWYRPSYFAAKYMQEHGYRIIPVNPELREVLGEKCYPDVAVDPGDVDIVDCFRKADEMPAARARGRRQGREGAVDAARHPQRRGGAHRERRAGSTSSMDRCVKIEHARIMGGLNWAGVNTGVISARRPTAAR